MNQDEIREKRRLKVLERLNKMNKQEPELLVQKKQQPVRKQEPEHIQEQPIPKQQPPQQPKEPKQQKQPQQLRVQSQPELSKYQIYKRQRSLQKNMLLASQIMGVLLPYNLVVFPSQYLIWILLINYILLVIIYASLKLDDPFKNQQESSGLLKSINKAIERYKSLALLQKLLENGIYFKMLANMVGSMLLTIIILCDMRVL